MRFPPCHGFSSRRTRPVREVRYGVRVAVVPDEASLVRRREEAGCFVLVTNVPAKQRSAMEFLTLYKEQHGIEQNFAFLKDPLIAKKSWTSIHFPGWRDERNRRVSKIRSRRLQQLAPATVGLIILSD